jgi:hypothetical protein
MTVIAEATVVFDIVRRTAAVWVGNAIFAFVQAELSRPVRNGNSAQPTCFDQPIDQPIDLAA